MDKLEEELVRVKAEIRAEVSNAFKELKNDIHQMDSRLAQCEKGMTECRQELQTLVSVKLTDMEKKLENNTGASWSEMVAKEVSTQMSGVEAEMALLHQQTRTIWEDKEEQEEMQRRKNSAIIQGLREPSVGNIESAKKEDGELISELLHELNCDDVSVNNFTRLGRRQEGPECPGC